MKYNFRICSLFLFFFTGLLFAQSNFQSVPDDQYWSNIFAHPGLFNRAEVVTNYNSTTAVFAGNFELPADSGGFDGYLLAFWDGTGWTIKAPGSINAFNSEFIYCICAVGTDVFIGGNFTTLNSKPISYLARWDGSEWSEVGSGVNGPVWALATDGFNLYVGGDFSRVGDTTANHIAKWDGFKWTRLEEQGGITDGVNNTVRSIAVGNDGVYVGGDFSIAGGINAYFAAKYNNQGFWQDLGVQWTTGSVKSIALAIDHIYLGGSFFTASGWPCNGIVRSDGSGGWEAVGSGSPTGVQKILITSSSSVIALGDFSADAGPAANLIAEWNGSSWQALGDQPFYSGQVVDIALLQPNTIYTTQFTFQDQNYLYGNGIYKWDGSAWSGVGFGIGDYWTIAYYVKTLAWYNSKLIAGGVFNTAGDQFISGLAQFDGSSWTDIGGNSTASSFFINKLLVNDNKLYVGGGYFSDIGGVSANNIAVWDGNTWAALGSGLDDAVETMHAIGNDVYVSGGFFNAGGSPAVGYAKWNGSSWSSLGNGGPSCYAMDNIGNDLYVGGQFTSFNGGTLMVNNLARWDGSAWNDVGGGVTQGSNFTTTVYALAVMGSKLIVGGNFTVAGSVPANNIAVWDGSQWSALGDGLDGTVHTILVSGTDIYAGGQFTMSGNNLIYSIAKWDGSSWHPLGSGIHQSNNFVATATVNVLLPTEDGLYVGGQFTHAGDKYSNMVALYTNFTTDVKNEVKTIPENFSLEQNYPNPFNPSTKIRYTIPSVGTSFMKFVKLKVYDILGNEIATLVNQEQPAGNYEVEFNSHSGEARNLPSGVYFYRIQAGSYTKTMKMILLK